MLPQLDRIQKIALARIVSDLIEADFIVEEKEMDFFESIISKEGANISDTMLTEAKRMDLAKAVTVLKELDSAGRTAVAECMKALALADGTCVPLEAIQIFAVGQALEHDAYIYSVPSADIGIANMQVIYIENDNGNGTAKAIENNLPTIAEEFAMAGFEFIYIPFVVADYRKMDPGYLKKVVRYMLPSVTPQRVDTICNDLQSMTTAKFCRDLLYKDINIPLLDVAPSLLIKISDSALIDQYGPDDAARTNYANFLRIELKGDTLSTVRSIVESYRSLINCPIVARNLSGNPKFMYYGFHRTLFDLIAFGKEKKDHTLTIDLTGSRYNIWFEPADGSGERIPIKLNPQETALYVMIIKKSFTGKGLDWREQMPEALKQSLIAEYNSIYSRIAKGNTTSEFKDRTQVHHIKNRIRAIQCVANKELFVPLHVKDGMYSFYMVNATPRDIRIKE